MVLDVGSNGTASDPSRSVWFGQLGLGPPAGAAPTETPTYSESASGAGGAADLVAPTGPQATPPPGAASDVASPFQRLGDSLQALLVQGQTGAGTGSESAATTASTTSNDSPSLANSDMARLQADLTTLQRAWEAVPASGGGTMAGGATSPTAVSDAYSASVSALQAAAAVYAQDLRQVVKSMAGAGATGVSPVKWVLA